MTDVHGIGNGIGIETVQIGHVTVTGASMAVGVGAECGETRNY